MSDDMTVSSKDETRGREEPSPDDIVNRKNQADLVERLEALIIAPLGTRLAGDGLQLGGIVSVLRDAKAEIERLTTDLAEARSLRHNLSEAAREIERLRQENTDQSDALLDASEKIERLRAELGRQSAIGTL